MHGCPEIFRKTYSVFRISLLWQFNQGLSNILDGTDDTFLRLWHDLGHAPKEFRIHFNSQKPSIIQEYIPVTMQQNEVAEEVLG